MNKILLFILCFFITLPVFAEYVEDEFAKNLPRNVAPVVVNNNYNYESVRKIPVQIKIVEEIKSEKTVYDGQEIRFKIAKDVKENDNIILKRGTEVLANVQVAISPGMNGIPASIIFHNFRIPNLKQGQLSENYEHFGQDRSLWVFPLKWALTPLPPTGSLTNFIMGGHVEVKPKHKILIYYYPDWI